MKVHAIRIMSDPRCETVNLREAAARLGIHESTLRAAARAGTAPVRVLTIGRRQVVVKADLDRLLGTPVTEREEGS